MKKALFLFNPHAGKGRISSAVPAIVDKLTKGGFLVTVYPTQAKSDATEKILALGDCFERIVVAGGDGMLHEAINGVLKLKSKPVLGYIPSGTVNDFARSHRIPLSPGAAAEIASGENSRMIDAGLFNGEYFSYVAAFGAGIDIAYSTDQGMKNALGQFAYYLSATKYMDPKNLNAACSEMSVTTDDGTFEGEFLFGAVSNSKSIGGFKQVIPKQSKLDDGMMEGLFIQKPLNILDLNRTVNNLLVGKLNTRGIVSVRSSSFRIRAKAPAPWTLDGEDGGEAMDITIRDDRQCLNMLLP